MYFDSEVGNYIIQDRISRGAFSEVYLAKHKIIDQIVACKIIDISKYGEDDEVCLAREVITLLQMDHPNIVFTFEYVIEWSYLYIFSEYVTGGSILSELKNCVKFSEQRAKKYFLEILSALEYLHKDRNIVHRDLKPQNILITNEDSIKLIDFGFCNSGGESDRYTSFVGTPGYTAPEIIKSEDYTSSCDIFSLGVILYSMVTGKSPFDLQNTDSKLLESQIEQIVYPDNLSAELILLMKGMLEPDPLKRVTLDEVIDSQWACMDSGARQIYSISRVPIDLRYSETLDSLSSAHRRPLMNPFKNAVDYLQHYRIERNVLMNELRTGVVSPKTAAYYILLKNNVVPYEESKSFEYLPCHVSKNLSPARTGDGRYKSSSIKLTDGSVASQPTQSFAKKETISRLNKPWLQRLAHT